MVDDVGGRSALKNKPKKIRDGAGGTKPDWDRLGGGSSNPHLNLGREPTFGFN